MKDILKDYPLKEFKLERVMEENSPAPHHSMSEYIPTDRFILVNPVVNTVGAANMSGKDLQNMVLFNNWKEGLKPEKPIKSTFGERDEYGRFYDSADENRYLDCIDLYEKDLKFYNLLFVEGMEVNPDKEKGELWHTVTGFEDLESLSTTETEPYKFVI